MKYEINGIYLDQVKIPLTEKQIIHILEKLDNNDTYVRPILQHYGETFFNW